MVTLIVILTIACVIMPRVSVMLDTRPDDIPLPRVSLRVCVTMMTGNVGHAGVVTRHGVVGLRHAPGATHSLRETGRGPGLIPVRGGRGHRGHGLTRHRHLEHEQH